LKKLRLSDMLFISIPLATHGGLQREREGEGGSGEGVEREWRGREWRGSGEGVEREWRASGEGVEREWRGSGEGVYGVGSVRSMKSERTFVCNLVAAI
jgi:hypothetical protein